MVSSRSSGLLAGLLVATWSFAASAMLQPHVAAYRLSLASEPTLGIPFAEVRGGLVIEWRRACDGWLSRQRLAFVGTLEEGGDLSHDVRFSSWEALDGSRMRYSYRSYGDEELQEDFRGEARLGPSAGGVATFTEPSQRAVDLPPQTIFPTTHIEKVLDEARAGARFVSHQVFDGAGFDSLTQITSVIGQPQTVAPLAQDKPDGGRAWRVSMAYYDLHEASDTPKFEAEFLLGENGVLRDVVLDYGDFQLDATLEKLELMTPPDC
ncbi:MAG: EipB family protein [Geminicoccaceae bacterium]